MKRANISPILCKRLERLIESDASAKDVTVGPRHDPYAGTEAVVGVRSLLGRFLTKKGYVDAELYAQHKTYAVSISVYLERRAREPRLRILVVGI